MPNRYLHDSICTSLSLSKVSLTAELLFLHLIVSADDYGRCIAEEPVLLGRLFTLRRDLSGETLMEALRELEDAELVKRYSHDGREYLQITKWFVYNKPRAKKSKCPEPPFAVVGRCKPMQTNAPDHDNDHGHGHGPDHVPGSDHNAGRLPKGPFSVDGGDGKR